MSAAIVALLAVVATATAQTLTWELDPCSATGAGYVDVVVSDLSEPVAGFQFTVTDAVLETVAGGLAEEAGHSTSFSGSTGIVISFSFSGTTYDCDGACVLTTMGLESPVSSVCVKAMIISASDGSFTVTDSACTDIALCVELEVSIQGCSGGSPGTLDIYTSNTQGYAIGGYQFTLTGAAPSSADGGLGADAGFSNSVSSATGIVIAFSFDGSSFTCDEDACLVVTVETDASVGDQVSMEEIIFSNEDGLQFQATSAGNYNIALCVELEVSIEGCSGGNVGSLDIYTSNTEGYGIGGYQFTLTGAAPSSAGGGLGADAGFSASVSSATGIVIGFSFDGSSFTCDEDACLVVTVETDAEDGDTISLEEIILSSGDGDEFQTTLAGDFSVALCIVLEISIEGCSGGEASSFDIYTSNTEGYAIGGYQFAIDGAAPSSAAGGLSADAGFSTSVSSTTGIVLAFSFDGSSFTCGEDACLIVSVETDASTGSTVCLEDLVFSDDSGSSFATTTTGCATVAICVELEIAKVGCSTVFSGNDPGGIDMYVSNTGGYGVGGYQFTVTGAEVYSGEGGLSEEAGFSISSGGSVVLAFSFDGSSFECEDESCWFVSISTSGVEGDSVCIDDMIFSEASGAAFQVTSQGCITLESCIVVDMTLEDVGAGGEVNIVVSSTEGEEIAGFQFDLDSDATLTGASGGLAADAGFEISFSESGTVLGFSLTGAGFSCADSCVMVTAFFDGEEGDEACLEEEILSTHGAGQFGTTVGACTEITFCVANGDINFDGNIDVLDIVLMVNQVIYPDQSSYADGSCELFAMDYNGDGNIDVLDIVSVVNLILYA